MIKLPKYCVIYSELNLLDKKIIDNIVWYFFKQEKTQIQKTINETEKNTIKLTNYKLYKLQEQKIIIKNN